MADGPTDVVDEFDAEVVDEEAVVEALEDHVDDVIEEVLT